MTVEVETARRLLDASFLFGRSLQNRIIHQPEESLPAVLVGMLFLLQRFGECRPSELSDRVGLSQSALSRQMADLVDRGLVERTDDPDDRRAVRVRVSDEGSALLERVRGARARRLGDLLDDWSDVDAAKAVDVLEALTERLAAADGTDFGCVRSKD